MNQRPITVTKKRRSGIFQRVALLVICIGLATTVTAEENFQSAGFAFDHFSLTLDDGFRTEAAGPFYYSQQSGTEKTWALTPFFSCAQDPAVESHEDDLFYPLVSRIRYGHEFRWQIFQLISFAGGKQPDDADVSRFTLYPVYFQQRSTDTNLNYTAVVPFYGRLKNRLYHDEIYFVMFPIYAETKKNSVVTENYLYPFGATTSGNHLRGWQVWPFAGREHQDLTTHTNNFGDAETVGGHDKSFYVWPLYLRSDAGLGTTNVEKFRASIPFFATTRTPQLDVTSVVWPFFNWLDNREKNYREWQMPWPFVIFARGEGKTTDRVFPLFSRSHNATLESDSYLWPLWQFHRVHDGILDQRRAQVLFYLYSRLAEKNTETGKEKIRLEMWPFFEWQRGWHGEERLQVFALMEPFAPENRGIVRNWSPLWSLWRAEDNPKTGATSRSLLWNLYRRETAPAHKKVSLLFGLFQYQCDGEISRTQWFYLRRTVEKTAAK